MTKMCICCWMDAKNMSILEEGFLLCIYLFYSLLSYCPFFSLGSLHVPTSVLFSPFFFSVFFFFLIKVQLTYNVSSVSVVQQNDPIIHSSLCCTVGPHCPSIPNITVCIPKHQTACPSHSLPPPPGNHQSALLGHDLFLFYVDRIIYAIFQIPQISDIMRYLSFSFWLTSLSTRISSSKHVAANGINLSFLSLSNISLYICTTYS